MTFDIITAFPNSFSFLKESIPKRAQEKGLVDINIHDLRDFSNDNRKTIDDRPYGGGAGMVLMVEPIYKALKSLGVYPSKPNGTKVLLMGARGNTWNQSMAESYRDDVKRVVLICGHYEGVDERILNMVDEEVSIGNYILSGGELASMVIVDSITRLVEGVVGKKESIERETTFGESEKITEHPNYTRPEVFKTEEGEEWVVPDTLLSGDHKRIEEWKEGNSKKMKL